MAPPTTFARAHARIYTLQPPGMNGVTLLCKVSISLCWQGSKYRRNGMTCNVIALNIQLRARLPDLHRFPGTDSVRPLFRQAHDPTIRVLGKHVAAAERIPARPHHLQTLAVQRVCRHRHSDDVPTGVRGC